MQKLYTLQDGRFSTWSHFWNIWCFFEGFFAKNYYNVNTESVFTCFRQFKILAQIKYFSKAIAHAKAIDFARWLIFNIVSFLEYLVFFRAVFCEELLQCEYRIGFYMF